MSEFNYKDIIESQLPHKAYKSNDVESNVLGRNLDRLQQSTDELELNINPQTLLEEGLRKWEKFFNLSVGKDETIETRRNKVLSELIQYMSDENVIRKDEMEDILGLFLTDVSVFEYFSEYRFEIETNQHNVNLSAIQSIISKVKPSWLNYDLLINLKNSLNLIQTTYEFPNELRICDLFTTEDNIPGKLENSRLDIKSTSYEFKVEYPICDLFTTETIYVNETSSDVDVIQDSRHNIVEFLRPGPHNFSGEGEI